jgi:hypothetical protein
MSDPSVRERVGKEIAKAMHSPFKQWSALREAASIRGRCRRPPTYAASELKPSQCALCETLTVSLALFGHVHNVLREGVPGSLGMAIHPESSFIGLDSLPSIVQRVAQNGNGLGVERCRIVLEIP